MQTLVSLQTELSQGPARLTRLDELGLIRLVGPQARQFLHSQTTNDVENLAADGVQMDGYCTPKGRLLASFVECATPDGLDLIVDRTLAASIARRLSMYVLRSKVKVSDLSADVVLYGVRGQGAAGHLAGRLGAAPGLWRSIVVDSVQLIGLPGCAADSPGRVLCVVPQAQAANWGERLGLGAAHSDAWWLEDIALGQPWIAAANTEQFVPQMINFELVNAVNFKKGCYPGQEIVARTQYLGKLKRRMVIAVAPLNDGAHAQAPSSSGTPPPCPPAAGADIHAAGVSDPVGRVVLSARSGEAVWLLAEMQLAAMESSGLTTNGLALHLQPLPYSLPERERPQ